MKTILSLALLCAAAVAGYAAGVHPFAPSLVAPIVDVYVPPTRADQPIVATGRVVYRYAGDSDSWLPVYEPPWQDTTILGISGYPKSSQGLYIVHSRGVSSSRDGGENWSESLLIGYPGDPGPLIGISVHPSNRKTAVFAFRRSCWITRDNAESFEQIHPYEQIVGAAFGAEKPDGSAPLLIATSEALYIEGTDGVRRLGLPSGDEAVRGLAVHPNRPYAYLSREDGRVLIVDIAHDSGALSGPFQVLNFAPLISGESSLWTVAGDTLTLVNLNQGEAFQLARTAVPIALIYAHPRRQDALYFAAENQLFILKDAFQGLPADTIAQLPAERFSPLDLVVSRRPTETNPNGTIAELIQSEPELQSVIAVVLARALESPEKTAAWSKRVRSRHWFPKLRLSGYSRQTAVDVSEIQTITDRYGLQRDDELRLSDDIRHLNWLGVTLTWDLERLAFDEDELYAAKERRLQSEERRDLAAEIAKLYYERIELVARYQGVFDDPEASTREAGGRDRLYLAIRERTDLLNAIAGQNLFAHL